MRTQENIGASSFSLIMLPQAVWICGIERNAVLGWEFEPWRSFGTFLENCEV
jgi:hypothetical protein